MKKFRINNENISKRIDRFLMGVIDISSRTFLQKILSETVTVNNKVVKQSYKLKDGDEVLIDQEKLEIILKKVDKNKEIEEEFRKLDIIFENDDYLVINKPKGIVVHPGMGNSKHTLVNYVKGYLSEKGKLDKRVSRVGLVHRLDKGVSGLIIFGKTERSQKYLQSLFEGHKVEKIYLAEVEEVKGIKINDSNLTEEIDKLEKNRLQIDNSWYCANGYIGRNRKNRIKMKYDIVEFNGSKRAISYIKSINNKQILIKIETGRMHQIRATLEYLGMRIVGDTLYGGKDGIPKSIQLESILLSFRDTSGERITFRLY